MSALLPEGCRSLADCPWNLADAILTGISFTSWDELELRDRPSKRIWFDAEKLQEWWRGVKRRRKEEMEGKSSPEIEGDVMQNDAAKDLIVG